MIRRLSGRLGRCPDCLTGRFHPDRHAVDDTWLMEPYCNGNPSRHPVISAVLLCYSCGRLWTNRTRWPGGPHPASLPAEEQKVVSLAQFRKTARG